MKHRLLFALIMGTITTAIISFALVAINIGFNERFLMIWLRSWPIADVLAVATILLFGPKVQWFVNYLLLKDLNTKEEDK